MSFACRGITHCYECGTSLNDNEGFLCTSCRQQQEEKEQKDERNRKQKQLIDDVRKQIMRSENLVVYYEESPNLVNTIKVNPYKESNINFNDFYANIGWQVLEQYYKGNKEIKILFESELNN